MPTHKESTLTWLGQAGYLLNLNGFIVCIDPYLSHSVERAEGLKRLIPIPIDPREMRPDLIVCTHDHLDHLDEDTLRQIPWEDCRFAGPTSCREHLRAMGIPRGQIITLNRGDSLSIAGASLQATFADHTADSIGLLIDHADRRVYLSGDTRDHQALQAIAALHPTVVCLCINGRLGNMDLHQAASLCRFLSPEVAIPNHYGMFAENTADPAAFRAALADSGIRVRALTVMEPVAWSQL